jgi:hypothetical protein
MYFKYKTPKHIQLQLTMEQAAERIGKFVYYFNPVGDPPLYEGRIRIVLVLAVPVDEYLDKVKVKFFDSNGDGTGSERVEWVRLKHLYPSGVGIREYCREIISVLDKMESILGSDADGIEFYSALQVRDRIHRLVEDAIPVQTKIPLDK